MPGWNDAHLHLADAGLQKLNVDLTGVRTLDEFRQRVLAKVETAKPGEWILGGGWDETMWAVKALPSRLGSGSGFRQASSHSGSRGRASCCGQYSGAAIGEYYDCQPATREAAKLIAMPMGSRRGFCAILRKVPYAL